MKRWLSRQEASLPPLSAATIRHVPRILRPWSLLCSTPSENSLGLILIIVCVATLVPARRCTGALSAERVFDSISAASSFVGAQLAAAVLLDAGGEAPVASDAVREAAFSALLALSEKLLNRHCSFFRLHGIPIIAASTGSSAAVPATVGSLLTAEPWRSTLAAGDSVDIYVEKASAWVSGFISTAVLGGQVRRAAEQQSWGAVDS